MGAEHTFPYAPRGLWCKTECFLCPHSRGRAVPSAVFLPGQCCVSPASHGTFFLQKVFKVCTAAGESLLRVSVRKGHQSHHHKFTRACMVCCHTCGCLQSNNSQVCCFSFCPNHSDTDKLKDRALGEVIHLLHRDFWPHVLYVSQHDTRPAVHCRNSSAQSIARSTDQTGELRIHQKYTYILPQPL